MWRQGRAKSKPAEPPYLIQIINQEQILMKVKFWGMRGSIPTPISPAAIENKIRQALRGAVGVDLSSEEAIERYLQRMPP